MGIRSYRNLLLSLLLVFGLTLSFSGVSMAATLTVGPVGQDYDSIQDAIDEAHPGDTIEVKAGTYNEDLRIDTDGLTLTAGDGPGTAEIIGEGTWSEVIYVEGGLGVTIDGFKISPGFEASAGITIDGGSPSSPVMITNNTFDGFSDYAFNVFGNSTALAGATVTISGNTISNCDDGITLYGLEDCTVVISNNTIENCSAYGIELEELGENMSNMNIQVTGNTITALDGFEGYIGIFISNIADLATISCNTVRGDFDYGIDLNSVGDEYEEHLPPVLTVEKNRVSGTQYGLYFDTLLYQAPGDATIRYNTLEDNVEGMIVNSYDPDEGSSIIIEDNNFVGNSDFGLENEDYVTLNAQGNWWGDDSGPYHPDTNPNGQGNEVSDFVDYGNWRTTAWEEESDSSSGCNAGILNPLFLLLLAPLGLLLRKSR